MPGADRDDPLGRRPAGNRFPVLSPIPWYMGEY